MGGHFDYLSRAQKNLASPLGVTYIYRWNLNGIYSSSRYSRISRRERIRNVTIRQ